MQFLTVAEIAKRTGISERMLYYAAKVCKQGIPALFLASRRVRCPAHGLQPLQTFRTTSSRKPWPQPYGARSHQNGPQRPNGTPPMPRPGKPAAACWRWKSSA